MTNQAVHEDELDRAIRLIQEAETDNFFELAKLLGRDPKTDLAGANLPNCDLSDGDLQGANLRKTNLSSANLQRANLRWADLSYSDISGANFTDADLTETKFYQVRAENAIFGNNPGMYERIRLDLSEQGAIFIVPNPPNPVESIARFLKYLLQSITPDFDDEMVFEIALIELSNERPNSSSRKYPEENSLNFFILILNYYIDVLNLFLKNYDSH